MRWVIVFNRAPVADSWGRWWRGSHRPHTLDVATSQPLAPGLIPSGEIVGLEGARSFNPLDRFRQSDMKKSSATSVSASVTLNVGRHCHLTLESWATTGHVRRLCRRRLSFGKQAGPRALQTRPSAWGEEPRRWSWTEAGSHFSQTGQRVILGADDSLPQPDFANWRVLLLSKTQLGLGQLAPLDGALTLLPTDGTHLDVVFSPSEP